ncbi:YihY/virulence factor BrkB family protein [Pirellulaceae bacterium SH449]
MSGKPIEQSIGRVLPQMVAKQMKEGWIARWFRQLFPNLRDAAIRWTEDDASSHAASVAYYLALSLFPMILLLTSGIGLVLQFTKIGRSAEAQLLSTLENQASPVVKVQVEQVLEQLRSHSIVTGPFGLAAALLAAASVFSQIDRGFDKIFRIPIRKESGLKRTLFRVLRYRFSAFLMLLGVGGVVLGLFAGSTMITQLRSVTDSSMPSLAHAFGIFDFLFEFLSNSLLFAIVYRWVPRKKVVWSDAFRGGLLAASIWEMGRVVLGVFLIGMRYTTAYGAIGSFIAILLWCYYGICILFFGAEYVQVLERRRAKSEQASPEPDITPPSAVPTISDYDSLEIPQPNPMQPDPWDGQTNPTGRTTKTEFLSSPYQPSFNEVGRELVSVSGSDLKQLPRRTPSYRK